MPDYTLHYFPESGNSYKLALMLTLCGQSFKPVWTDFGSGITWTDEWRRAVNPMGEIPVLVEDGVTFTQTAPILLRLADKFERFQGSGESERFEILRWLFWDNQKLSGFMAAYRYRRAFLETSNPHVLAFLKGFIYFAPQGQYVVRGLQEGTELWLSFQRMVKRLQMSRHR